MNELAKIEPAETAVNKIMKTPDMEILGYAIMQTLSREKSNRAGLHHPAAVAVSNDLINRLEDAYVGLESLAALPDLLAALESTCDLLDSVMGRIAQDAPHLLPKFGPDIERAMSARAAIKKARRE